MFVIKSEDNEYVESGIDGISQSSLWDNGTNGGTSLVRLKANAYFPSHSHPGWEQAYVLAGTINVGNVTLNKGDYLFAEPGDIHGARALEDTELLVFTEKGIELLENS